MCSLNDLKFGNDIPVPGGRGEKKEKEKRRRERRTVFAHCLSVFPQEFSFLFLKALPFATKAPLQIPLPLMLHWTSLWVTCLHPTLDINALRVGKLDIFCFLLSTHYLHLVPWTGFILSPYTLVFPSFKWR